MKIGVPSAIVSPFLRMRFANRLLEHVTHRRGGTFDGEELGTCPLGGRSSNIVLVEVAARDDLRMDEHAVGLGIVVAEDRVGQLVHEGIRLEAELA